MTEPVQADDIRWWNRLAEKLNGYQGTYRVSYEGATGEAEFVSLVNSKLNQQSTVLDIGCADGVFASRIAPLAGKVTAVDLSPVMIEKARSLQNEQLEFLVADGRQLPFPENAFDIVVSRRGPVSEPGFWEEAVRVVKPGGFLVEITIGNRDAVEWKELFGRGQGYAKRNTSRYMDIVTQIEAHPGVRLREAHEYIADAVYPELEDVTLQLSSTPIVDDFDLVRDREVVRQLAETCRIGQGIRRTYHRIVWAAQKQS
ncbi:class I SAM-dependent methyltransferase [Paenibacillus sp. y28]|uniref:class I SAM-dependent methyltransferase n=1 Tax=Paenibacillus sp. y28 TaxID=3129110 RepID=UPI00301927B7